MPVSKTTALPTDPAVRDGARARSRQATRNRLLRSARELFAARGLLRVTTHDIAHGAGVAAGTFYLHFKDKESVFREIVYDAIADLRERLRAAMRDAPDRRSAIRAHADALVGFAEDHRDLVRIVFGRDHGAAELESDVLDYLATCGADVLRERMAAGMFRPTLNPAVAAQALTGMFTRVVVWWIEDQSRATREQIVDTLCDIQLGGTTPGAGGAASAETTTFRSETTKAGDPGDTGRQQRSETDGRARRSD